MRRMKRTDVALMAVLYLGALAASIKGNTAAVVLSCFLIWQNFGGPRD